ncbi:response regulator [Paraburkholderia sp. DHOC27]|uniref:response regulator n=1 Tax=Paraburkholderia sp. DHOC27 TaxID=2303330 RepID=UPI00216B08BA|nr:response regulator [Paraburkholderia sp. DHOC27]
MTSPSTRVLVVDDNVNAARALAAYLELDEFDCRLAFGGIEAIRVGIDWRPHVVIMDISMPQCNGFQAAMALRQSEHTHDIAIIAFTALDEAEVRRHLSDHEFDGYCQKGEGPVRLFELINQLVLAV